MYEVHEYKSSVKDDFIYLPNSTMWVRLLYPWSISACLDLGILIPSIRLHEMIYVSPHDIYKCCLSMWMSPSPVIWGHWCEKQVSQAGLSNCIPQNTVGCNYLSLPEIPASGTQVLIYAEVHLVIVAVIPGLGPLPVCWNIAQQWCWMGWAYAILYCWMYA